MQILQIWPIKITIWNFLKFSKIIYILTLYTKLNRNSLSEIHNMTLKFLIRIDVKFFSEVLLSIWRRSSTKLHHFGEAFLVVVEVDAFLYFISFIHGNHWLFSGGQRIHIWVEGVTSKFPTKLDSFVLGVRICRRFYDHFFQFTNNVHCFLGETNGF